ncbi:extracellular solute-binding protein [Bradyrhizobium sp.]|jgi:putative spermidine/putrescine transport system substrate-binding protein|uniref:extracellular solute-binding protein n=1 Tax=Bradyrhizobium sp. TaxID=376 RepID=UPI002C3C683E|nr:extracellular solute-binding protein [Bradyrhizobium sp.]HWX56904.1 extracellular solute-binding protein [Bradyrhizobium sp.]
MTFTPTRRSVVAGLAGSVAFNVRAFADSPPLPSSPVSLNIVDVAGNLALTQKAIEAYRAKNPKLVSKITFTKAPAPELPGKIKAQQDAGRVDIDGVLTGIDALSAGVDQKLWIPTVTENADRLPKLDDIYQPGARAMQGLAANQGVCIVFCPAGPVMEYMPDKVKQVPATAEELLAWAKANPNRFMYARPANSGPGRVFMMGLPYILGDKDPKDPKDGWDKTWAYLKELGQNVEYYPGGTGAVMKELGEGSRDMVPSQMGWDINPRALGVVPKEAKVFFLKGFHWVLDAHYLCIPKGVGPDKLAVLLDLTSYLLGKEAQATTYDTGYFYPGPAVKDVTLAMAPEDSQNVIKEFGRPEYAAAITDNKQELPLTPDKLVYAFSRWDEQVGAQKKK